MDIFLCALLALIEMPVTHHCVFVKLIKGLFNFALKTSFETNHAVLLVQGIQPL
jgi:hypothetical protein